MVNYENGKIYRLKSKSTNQSYIGSTAMPYLSQRLAKHLSNYKDYNKNPIPCKNMTSYKILKCEDYEIELICNFSCANKQQLEKEEGKYIKREREEGIYDCVNRFIAGRTSEEYKQDNKEMIKEKRKTCDKKRYDEKRDEILQQIKKKNLKREKNIMKITRKK